MPQATAEVPKNRDNNPNPVTLFQLSSFDAHGLPSKRLTK